MHFVSEYAGKTLVRKETPVFSQATGEKIQTLATVWITLERGTAPQWAVDAAVKHFSFATRPRAGAIGGRDVPAEEWAAYVDTEQWAQLNGYDDTVREAAEAKLSAKTDVIAVETPKLMPPWPKYDELTVQGQRTADKVAAKNLETALEIGVPVEYLIQYEGSAHARPAVLEAYERELEALQQPSGDAALLVEA